jgi:ABC-type branched-subunit amino acid transport system ATPase component
VRHAVIAAHGDFLSNLLHVLQLSQPFLALDMADRAYVLVNGRVDIEGRAEDLRGNLHEIEGIYLGAD